MKTHTALARATPLLRKLINRVDLRNDVWCNCVYLERGASQVHKLIAEHIGKVPAKTATQKKNAMKAKKKAMKK